MNGRLPDFEFVYDFEDFTFYRSHEDTVNHTPMPGFGCVRCWQKGFMSFPMMGSHGHRDIKDVDDKIAEILDHNPRPFSERKAAAVFRGGFRGCSFPPEHDDRLDWVQDDALGFYKDAPCGGQRLAMISHAHPHLVDFVDTDGGSGRMSMKDQEVIHCRAGPAWAWRRQTRGLQAMCVCVCVCVCVRVCWWDLLFVPPLFSLSNRIGFLFRLKSLSSICHP